ncbi:hypothetical protein P3G22_10340 [Rhodopseudomonas sp. BAL398]|nr:MULTISPECIES: hypothetical protein [Rhodopseudomonas]MDF3810684.1 hypothetical protein [Rhodopseudomonas sp. BAL398]
MTPNSARGPARAARLIARNNATVERDSVCLVQFPLSEEIKREHLAMRRQFTSTLRQFNRDIEAIISRSLDRGVVPDILKAPSDRSSPVTRERV